MSCPCLEDSNEEKKFTASLNCKSLINRTARIKGQVAGIKRMFGDEAGCIDLMHQIHSTKRALEGLAVEIMRLHLEGCIRPAMRADGEFDQKLVDFIETAKSFQNKDVSGSNNSAK